jgi:hypothetical protein
MNKLLISLSIIFLPLSTQVAGANKEKNNKNKSDEGGCGEVEISLGFTNEIFNQ